MASGLLVHSRKGGSRRRPITFLSSMAIAVCLIGSADLRGGPVNGYVPHFYTSQIPSGQEFEFGGAFETPGGVSVYGTRSKVGGISDRRAAYFPTPSSNMVILTNPQPTDSTTGYVEGGASTSLGATLTGGFDVLHGSTDSGTHVAIWRSSSDRPTDLSVVSGTASRYGGQQYARAISATANGFQIVGAIDQGSYQTHLPGIWSGSSVTSVTFTSLLNSSMKGGDLIGAYSQNGVAKQFGSATFLPAAGSTNTTSSGAMVWSGTPDSAVDITPDGTRAEINCASGGQTEYFGGFLSNDNFQLDHRGVVWTGTDKSYRVMNGTAAYKYSTILGLTQTQACGFIALGSQNGVGHAAVWDIATGTAIDLTAFLPAQYQTVYADSSANFIDSAGNIYGWAQPDLTVAPVPVVWAVPEPLDGTSVTAFGSLIALARRRRTGNPCA